MDVHPFGAQADLPGVGEQGAGQPGDRLLDVHVVEHDRGVLAAQLERDRAHPRGDSAHDRGAGGGRAGEGHPVDAGMLGEELPGRVPAEAVHDVVDPCRYAGLVQDLGEQRGRRRRLLRRLDDHGVPARDGRGDLPGEQQQGQVPRHDHRHHTERLADGVVQRLPALGEVGDEGVDAGRGQRVGERPEVVAARATSRVRACACGLPVSPTSASTSSSKRRSMTSAALRSMRTRSVTVLRP